MISIYFQVIAGSKQTHPQFHVCIKNLHAKLMLIVYKTCTENN